MGDALSVFWDSLSLRMSNFSSILQFSSVSSHEVHSQCTRNAPCLRSMLVSSPLLPLQERSGSRALIPADRCVYTVKTSHFEWWKEDSHHIHLNPTACYVGKIEMSQCILLFHFQLRERLGISLGERPPTLVPVSHVMMCMNCGCDFKLTLRRHHCHACGKVSVLCQNSDFLSKFLVKIQHITPSYKGHGSVVTQKNLCFGPYLHNLDRKANLR